MKGWSCHTVVCQAAFGSGRVTLRCLAMVSGGGRESAEAYPNLGSAGVPVLVGASVGVPDRHPAVVGGLTAGLTQSLSGSECRSVHRSRRSGWPATLPAGHVRHATGRDVGERVHRAGDDAPGGSARAAGALSTAAVRQGKCRRMTHRVQLPEVLTLTIARSKWTPPGGRQMSFRV